MGYILGIDAGTTSFKAGLYDEKGMEIASARENYSLLTPSPSVVEFDPESYWKIFKRVLNKTLADANKYANVRTANIKALAIDSQGETLICLDREGSALRNAIVWLDNRSYREADAIRDQFGNEKVYNITGQPEVTATWPATKIMWLREHEPDIYSRTYKYLLLEDYLIYKLTGEYTGEKSLYSSSLLIDIHNGFWWKDILDFIGISDEQLPDLLESGKIVGKLTKTASEETGIDRDTLVVTGALDQTAGIIGAGSIKPGTVTETTGSCLAVCANIEKPIPYNDELRIPCHYHAMPGKYYLLLWSQSAGMALEWFKDNFYENDDMKSKSDGRNIYKLIDDEAQLVPPGCEGLTMLPHLSGAAFPEFNPHAKGAFYGITLNHGRAHFARAVLESTAYTLKRDIEILELLGFDIKEIKSLGGGSKSGLWNQIKADATGKTIAAMKNSETSCQGAAILAGSGAGIYGSVEQACSNMADINRRYEPDGSRYSIYNNSYKRYLMLYERLESMFGID